MILIHQILTPCITGDTLSHESVFTYCQMDPWDQTSVEFDDNWTFFNIKMPLIMLSVKYFDFVFASIVLLSGPW